MRPIIKLARDGTIEPLRGKLMTKLDLQLKLHRELLGTFSRLCNWPIKSRWKISLTGELWSSGKKEKKRVFLHRKWEWSSVRSSGSGSFQVQIRDLSRIIQSTRADLSLTGLLSFHPFNASDAEGRRRSSTSEKYASFYFLSTFSSLSLSLAYSSHRPKEPLKRKSVWNNAVESSSQHTYIFFTTLFFLII